MSNSFIDRSSMRRLNIHVTAESNRGGRCHMEDYMTFKMTCNRSNPRFPHLGEQIFMGIFDGHGGKEAARHARDRLWDILQDQPKYQRTDVKSVMEALSDAYVAVHKEMEPLRATWSKHRTGDLSTAGTTASTVLLRDDNMYVANVGDSTAVLAIRNPTPNQHPVKAVVLTKDHKPEDIEEILNIQELGGDVMKSKKGTLRVIWERERNGGGCEKIPFLGVSRALGDFWSFCKRTNKFTVSPKPDVSVRRIDPKVMQFVVIASDGLWNVMTPDEVVQYIWNYQHSEELVKRDVVKALLREALRKWTAKGLPADNIAILICFVSESVVPDCEPTCTLHPANSPVRSQEIRSLVDPEEEADNLETIADIFNAPDVGNSIKSSAVPKNAAVAIREPEKCADNSIAAAIERVSKSLRSELARAPIKELSKEEYSGAGSLRFKLARAPTKELSKEECSGAGSLRSELARAPTKELSKEDCSGTGSLCSELARAPTKELSKEEYSGAGSLRSELARAPTKEISEEESDGACSCTILSPTSTVKPEKSSTIKSLVDTETKAENFDDIAGIFNSPDAADSVEESPVHNGVAAEPVENNSTNDGVSSATKMEKCFLTDPFIDGGAGSPVVKMAQDTDLPTSVAMATDGPSMKSDSGVVSTDAVGMTQDSALADSATMVAIDNSEAISCDGAVQDFTNFGAGCPDAVETACDSGLPNSATTAYTDDLSMEQDSGAVSSDDIDHLSPTIGCKAEAAEVVLLNSVTSVISEEVSKNADVVGTGIPDAVEMLQHSTLPSYATMVASMEPSQDDSGAVASDDLDSAGVATEEPMSIDNQDDVPTSSVSSSSDAIGTDGASTDLSFAATATKATMKLAGSLPLRNEDKDSDGTVSSTVTYTRSMKTGTACLLTDSADLQVEDEFLAAENDDTVLAANYKVNGDSYAPVGRAMNSTIHNGGSSKPVVMNGFMEHAKDTTITADGELSMCGDGAAMVTREDLIDTCPPTVITSAKLASTRASAKEVKSPFVEGGISNGIISPSRQSCNGSLADAPTPLSGGTPTRYKRPRAYDFSDFTLSPKTLKYVTSQPIVNGMCSSPVEMEEGKIERLALRKRRNSDDLGNDIISPKRLKSLNSIAWPAGREVLKTMKEFEMEDSGVHSDEADVGAAGQTEERPIPISS